MLNPLYRILLLCAIVTGILVGTYAYGYARGYRAGAAEIQAQWDADKQAAREAHDELVQKLAKQEAVHASDQEQIAHDLAQARSSFDVALAGQRDVYEHRLLQSARRGQVYRDQAEASATSCRDLAGHAAELDRALEEGVGLVGELQEALGLREHQLKLLGDQILDDRRLMEGEPK